MLGRHESNGVTAFLKPAAAGRGGVIEGSIGGQGASARRVNAENASVAGFFDQFAQSGSDPR